MTTNNTIESSFLANLAQVIQANDLTGVYRSLSPQQKVEVVFIPNAEDKGKLAECGIIPENLKEHISCFFQAVAFSVEQQTGIMASSIIELNDEGFGRGMVYCGKLIALNKSIRGSQQFLFQNLEKLEKVGQAFIEEAVMWIHKYKEIAVI